jgi:hypothetical protein
MKQDGPEFSPDDKASRKHENFGEKTAITSAKGGARRLHRFDDDDDDRPPSLGTRQRNESGTASDSPTLDWRKPSGDSHGKTISSIPRKSLKETGPEFSPDANASQKAVREKDTSSTSLRRRTCADEKYSPPAIVTSRQVKRNAHEEPSFYHEEVSNAMANTNPPPVSKQGGSEFSPDYSAARDNKSRKKLHKTRTRGARQPPQQKFAKSLTRESGAKCTLPTNVANLPVERDGKLMAKASLSRDRALTPGATAVSPLKQSTKNSNGINEPQLYPDEEAVYSDTKKPAESPKKVSKGNKENSDSVDDFQIPEGSAAPQIFEGSADTSSTEGFTETSAGITPNFRPRPPRNRTTPGAFRVDGLDGPSDDNDFYDDEVSEGVPAATEGTGSLPVAKPANESNRNIIDGLGEAEPISPDDLKGHGIMGWIRQHKVWSAIAILVVIGAVVGGVVGVKLVGGTPPPAPTLQPTLAPTSAPTLLGFETIADTLLTVTPYSVLTDPTTAQNAAVTWLMRENEYDIDFGDSSKLLQRYSLATIYFATGGPSWTNQLQFLTNQDDCMWNDIVDNVSFGVRECNDQGLATKLQLSFNGLQGTLPEEVGGMPFLVEFGAASSSRLSGTLPQDIGNLSKLTHLDLETNYLSGLLPTSFYNLTSLENISLLQNSFSGSLASSIGNFVLLKQMQLSMNQFTGIIPSDVARMTSLVNIYLDNNNFSGGMENFCTADINFKGFQSDCFFHEIVAPDPEVECSCCTVCCRNGDNAAANCVPNDGTFLG